MSVNDDKSSSYPRSSRTFSLLFCNSLFNSNIDLALQISNQSALLLVTSLLGFVEKILLSNMSTLVNITCTPFFLFCSNCCCPCSCCCSFPCCSCSCPCPSCSCCSCPCACPCSCFSSLCSCCCSSSSLLQFFFFSSFLLLSSSSSSFSLSYIPSFLLRPRSSVSRPVQRVRTLYLQTRKLGRKSWSLQTQ